MQHQAECQIFNLALFDEWPTSLIYKETDSVGVFALWLHARSALLVPVTTGLMDLKANQQVEWCNFSIDSQDQNKSSICGLSFYHWIIIPMGQNLWRPQAPTSVVQAGLFDQTTTT